MEPQLRLAACRSRWPRTSASRAAASSTRRSARCATSCRTTCCRSSRLLAMEPPVAADADALRDEKVRLFRQVRDRSTRPRSCAASTAATATSPASTPGSRRRDLRRPAARDRLVALGRRAVAGPHGQEAAGHRHRGRRDASTPRPGCCSRRPARPAPTPTTCASGSGSDDGRDAAAPGQGARRRARDPAGRPRGVVRRALFGAPAGGLRAPARGRHGRRPPPLRPGRRRRGAVAHRRAASSTTRPRSSCTEAGTWGPPRPTRLAAGVGGWIEPLAD